MSRENSQENVITSICGIQIRSKLIDRRVK